MKDERNLLTLEERLDRLKKFQAFSPEAAANMVLRIAEGDVYDLFDKYHMERFWDIAEGDDELLQSQKYIVFCRNLTGSLPENTVQDPVSPYKPVLGYRMNNAILTIAFAFVDVHILAMRNPEAENIFAPYIRMTLGDYLDALVDLSFLKDGGFDENRSNIQKIFRESVSDEYDVELPFAKALGSILRDYAESWHVYHYVDYLFDDAAGQLKNPDGETESDILERAQVCFPDGCRVPPIGTSMLFCRKRHMKNGYYFLNDARSYAPKELLAEAENDLHPGLLQLLKENIADGRLEDAMKKMNASVGLLYMLLVSPYLDMRSYHYEHHIE